MIAMAHRMRQTELSHDAPVNALDRVRVSWNHAHDPFNCFEHVFHSELLRTSAKRALACLGSGACAVAVRVISACSGPGAFGALAMTVIAANATPAQTQVSPPWQTLDVRGETLAQRISPPQGFHRLTAGEGSFAAWLRSLPMKPANASVLLYTGVKKARQDAHAAVIDIDVGKRDLQQCADAVMRLRAEWLWSIGAIDRIAFNYTGGGRVSYTRFAAGDRPSQDGKRWRRSAKSDKTYAGFRRYMTNVFVYAGTYSLSRELVSVPDGVTPKIGDVIIKGGFPGHAVLVVDAAENPTTGENLFLLAQSYMPAQDIHILKNPAARDGSPWYASPIVWPLVTPEWTFEQGSLKRWGH